MSIASLTLALACFGFIGLLPRVFFRSDGRFNIRWWAVALPFFLTPVVLVAAYNGWLGPQIGEDSERVREILAVVLYSGSIALIGLTLGTNRVPLALWHQENDAPKGIVTYGAYRYIRHPFYSSFLLAMIASVILLPHVATVAVLVYMFTALNVTAAREERRLAQSQFGEEYRSYLTRSGRFFPRF
jgi:protein-S-isoprenylcysteine O-methyltransferase Ste14